MENNNPKVVEIKTIDFSTFNFDIDKNNIIQSNIIHDNSEISISDLKDMQSPANLPKKSRRRRNGSDKNTISLDI